MPRGAAICSATARRAFPASSAEPARQALGVQVAERHVGVGQRDLGAALVVADGPGHRPRAPRPHVQRPRPVHVHDAAAARADLRDVDGGHAQQEAAALVEPAALRHGAADLELAGALDLVPLDDRGLRGRPAHVDAERVGRADRPGQRGGGDDAGGGPRLDHVHRALAPALGGHDAAVGLHDEERRPGLQRAQLALERGEVAAHHRHHVGVGDRGAGALELAHLGQDLGGEGERHVGRALADHRAHLRLVGRVGVGVQEADRDRLHALGEQPVDGGGRAVPVQRRHHLAAVVHALPDLAPPPAGHQRRRALEVEVVEPREAQPADLEQVAEALGGQEAGARAATLQDRVGGHGGAVDELADRRAPRCRPARSALGCPR